jgi:hypothetical protein
MLLALQAVAVAVVPLNFTVLVPCVAPKFVPATTIDEPTAPLFGVRLVMLGGVKTVKFTPLLPTPFTVTTTLPVVDPAGTVAVMLLALHAVAVAVVPLNVTVLVPGVSPKFVPAITIEEPTVPLFGVRLVMLGVGSTVKGTPLLANPPTRTTILPLVANRGTGTTICVSLQLVGAAVVPLKFTTLDPCTGAKPVPVMVTEAPIGPELRERPVMLGVTPSVTVYRTPLPVKPLAVTTTFPVVAPTGTGTTMAVLFQLLGVAKVPLKLTVPLP